MERLAATFDEFIERGLLFTWFETASVTGIGPAATYQAACPRHRGARG